MKIAIFTDTYIPQVNGVVTVVHDSARALAQMGHQVCIVCVANKIKTPNGDIPGVKIYRLPSLPFWGYSGERFAVPLGRSVVQMIGFKPDIIHSHTSFSVGWEAVLCAKVLRIPLVGTHHTFYDHYLKHVKLDFPWVRKFSWKFFAAYFNRVQLLLSPSRALATELIAYGLKKPVEVIYNPIDTDFYLPIKSISEKPKLKKKYGLSKISLVYMGRLSYEKSLDIVIEAFAKVLNTQADCKLMIIGDGPERANLEKLGKKLGIQKSLVFTGYLHGQDLLEAMQASDIFVTASKSENMPMSVLEAMSTGLPVIGADSRGIPEVVKQDVNGMLCEPDDIKDFSDKMSQLIRRDDLRKKFALASRELALDHSDLSYAKQLEAYYLKLLRKKR
jgi:1,2-diacylglycerol 3-alpha-glucosyltransferase